MYSSVLLPEPEGPVTANASPSDISSERSFNTTDVPAGCGYSLRKAVDGEIGGHCPGAAAAAVCHRITLFHNASAAAESASSNERWPQKGGRGKSSQTPAPSAWRNCPAGTCITCRRSKGNAPAASKNGTVVRKGLFGYRHIPAWPCYGAVERFQREVPSPCRNGHHRRCLAHGRGKLRQHYRHQGGLSRCMQECLPDVLSLCPQEACKNIELYWKIKSEIPRFHILISACDKSF